ncbi:uncharacterized protein JN550_004320 [Neoarthrinium moseri]|uniref:uncharacterized protein n=1 Tax=Neoarthrinium moseri TaxID=1658444 RepID=UPI001FDB5818|nr:uncharacterized protein JN550_004320 [Neoarthrinium moseri]KAI1872117.1 hypothetical protein JN550_004320 [Neoarthrinium moseri]
MSAQQPSNRPLTGEPTSSAKNGALDAKARVGEQRSVDETPPYVANLASENTQRMEAALGDAILRFLRIRKGPKGDEYDLDATATQSSIWDADNVEEYKELYIHPKWENWAAFDPKFRWTWREERAVRRKVDWKIMVWVCIMFASLNIDRNNINNAVSDNMLDDLDLTRADYVSLCLSSSSISWIGPDLWIPIQICLFSLISGAQFFLSGPASFLATRYLMLAWYWMSSQLVDIGVGFAAVGLVSMRGILGYEGWRWLFLIEGAFTFIRDDPQKGGMYNRQGLSVRQIWECTKDYDMWPLYILGLLFGLPKYPVNQYLTLSFRGLGFNVIQTNLLSIPNIVGSSIMMLLITAFSELVNNRSFVSMAEDAWLLPCFVALLALPNPSAWAYFAISTVLLSFPYHPIQVAWTSRNAGSIQNRTVSASLYNMWVQVSGMIGANIYQPDDAPRYYKANKRLLVICVWMCLVQYPVTYFYYRWRNQSKAKVWDIMTPEEQETYRKTTTDEGNKRLDFRFAT